MFKSKHNLIMLNIENIDPFSVHLILSPGISYPNLVKFHYFAHNSQEGVKKHHMRATQVQEGMTLWITVACSRKFQKIPNFLVQEITKFVKKKKETLIMIMGCQSLA